eukprot:1155429-Alexandrium_andersonii.AAC.1
MIVYANVGFDRPVRVYNIYAWAGAKDHIEARVQSLAMFKAIAEDLAERPQELALVLGDFNMPLSMAFPFVELLDAGVLHDVASYPHLTGSMEGLTTCRARTAKEETRRDFALVSGGLLPYVCAVRTECDAGYDVHKPLHVVMTPPVDKIRRVFAEPLRLGKPEEADVAQWKEALQQEAESAFVGVDEHLCRCVHGRDAHEYWRVWSTVLHQVFVAAHVKCGGQDPGAADKVIRGFAAVQVQNAVEAWRKQPIKVDGDEAEEVTKAAAEL